MAKIIESVLLKWVRLFHSKNCDNVAVFGQQWPHGRQAKTKTVSDFVLTERLIIRLLGALLLGVIRL